MTKYTTFTFLALLCLACSTKTPSVEFREPERSEVFLIVNLVLKEKCNSIDSFDIGQVYVVDTLSRMHLYPANDSALKRGMYQWLLKDVDYLDTLGFNSQDTSYLIAQEQFIEKMRIDTTDLCLPSRSLHAMLELSNTNFKSGHIYNGGYFTLSIPVFSVKQDMAIISIAFNGYSAYSYYEELYLLRKFQDHWHIIRKRTIGIS